MPETPTDIPALREKITLRAIQISQSATADAESLDPSRPLPVPPPGLPELSDATRATLSESAIRLQRAAEGVISITKPKV